MKWDGNIANVERKSNRQMSKAGPEKAAECNERVWTVTPEVITECAFKDCGELWG